MVLWCVRSRAQFQRALLVDPSQVPVWPHQGKQDNRQLVWPSSAPGVPLWRVNGPQASYRTGGVILQLCVACTLPEERRISVARPGSCGHGGVVAHVDVHCLVDL